MKNLNWKYINCGCFGGLQLGGESLRSGGESLRECPNCKGGGSYFRHIKSGVLAEYPGGPFLGREPK